MLADHLFNLQPVLLIAAIVDPVCIQEEDVAGTHERDFRQVRGFHFPCPERHRKILVPIRIVLGNWWWVAEIYKTERSTGTYLTVEHGRDLARIVILIPSQRVPRRHRLCQPKINLLENVRCCCSVPVQFGKHEGMESVVYSGRNFCRDDPMPLSVDQQHSRRRVEFLQIFGDSQLLRALGSSVPRGGRRVVARLRLQPLHMLIHRVSRRLPFGKRLQVQFRPLEGACDAGVNVVPLLEVDVLKKIAPHASGRNGVAIHVDAGQLGNHPLHWHQSLA